METEFDVEEHQLLYLANHVIWALGHKRENGAPNISNCEYIKLLTKNPEKNNEELFNLTGIPAT